MIISNSLGKNKIDSFPSSSTLLLRSDGFKKVVKGLSASKAQHAQENSHAKLHTSSGFRRVTKQYRLHADNDGRTDCFDSSTHMLRTMTASKELGKRSTMFVAGSSNSRQEKKTVDFLKMEQEEQQCFRNVCRVLNVL